MIPYASEEHLGYNPMPLPAPQPHAVCSYATHVRATNATRLALVWLGRWFDWWHALAAVQPGAFTRWHRQGFRLFWRWKFTPGRPPIPVEIQALIRQMVRDNPTWGQECIANELLLKLGLRVAPRTGRKYMPHSLERGGPTVTRDGSTSSG
jgi:hypothetical protein